MLKSNNHGFLKIKVLSLMMPWMTRQGERQVSQSQRHLERYPQDVGYGRSLHDVGQEEEEVEEESMKEMAVVKAVSEIL